MIPKKRSIEDFERPIKSKDVKIMNDKKKKKHRHKDERYNNKDERMSNRHHNNIQHKSSKYLLQSNEK